MVASSVRHPIKIGGTTYDVSPISDEGREALDEWVRSKFVERTAPLIEKLKSDADKALALQVAYRQAFALTWMSGEGAEMMGTVDGVARMLYEGIRPNHPLVTYEELRAQLFDPSNIRLATAAFEELNTTRDEALAKGNEQEESPAE